MAGSEVQAEIDRLARLYDAAEDAGDRVRCRQLYDRLLQACAAMGSDGNFRYRPRTADIDSRQD